MLGRSARSGTYGVPPMGLGGSGGGNGSMTLHSSSGTNSFVIKQDPTEVSPSRFAGHVKLRLAAVTLSRPTAASFLTGPLLPDPPSSCLWRGGSCRCPSSLPHGRLGLC